MREEPGATEQSLSIEIHPVQELLNNFKSTMVTFMEISVLLMAIALVLSLVILILMSQSDRESSLLIHPYHPVMGIILMGINLFTLLVTLVCLVLMLRHEIAKDWMKIQPSLLSMTTNRRQVAVVYGLSMMLFWTLLVVVGHEGKWQLQQVQAWKDVDLQALNEQRSTYIHLFILAIVLLLYLVIIVVYVLCQLSRMTLQWEQLQFTIQTSSPIISSQLYIKKIPSYI